MMTDAELYRMIGSLIKAQRKLAHMSQAQLAEAIGLSRPAIANIEAGRQGILVAMIYRIAAGLGCAPGDLAPRPRLASRDVIFLRRRAS